MHLGHNVAGIAAQLEVRIVLDQFVGLLFGHGSPDPTPVRRGRPETGLPFGFITPRHVTI
ncbi:MAG: hypothetical protein NVSMB43_04790 [Pseudarthrobacter sp.]